MRDAACIVALFSLTALCMWAVFEYVEETVDCACEHSVPVVEQPKFKTRYSATLKVWRPENG